MKRCLITYCSRRKSDAPGLLPAVERYSSPRIRLAQKKAAELNADFFILSGQFGLLHAEDPIPWYDHLLQPEEVEDMAGRMVPIISEYDEIAFAFTPGDFIDPYRLALFHAVQSSGKIGLSIMDEKL